MTRIHHVFQVLALATFGASTLVVAGCGGQASGLSGSTGQQLQPVSLPQVQGTVVACGEGYAHPNVCCEGGGTSIACGVYASAPFHACSTGSQTYPDPRSCCPLGASDGSGCIAPPPEPPPPPPNGWCTYACPLGQYSDGQGGCCEVISNDQVVCYGYGSAGSSPGSTGGGVIFSSSGGSSSSSGGVSSSSGGVSSSSSSGGKGGSSSSGGVSSSSGGVSSSGSSGGVSSSSGSGGSSGGGCGTGCACAACPEGETCPPCDCPPPDPNCGCGVTPVCACPECPAGSTCACDCPPPPACPPPPPPPTCGYACPAGWQSPQGEPFLCCQTESDGVIECFSQAIPPQPVAQPGLGGTVSNGGSAGSSK